MRKASLYVIALVGLGLVTASCSKEQRTDGNAPVFKAGVEKNTKTSFSEATNLVWTDGDQVAIYGSASAPATYHPENIQEDAQYCDLVVTEGNPGDGPYTAIYPVSIAKNSTTVTLPAKQASVAGELTAYPMYAQSNSTVLSFKNLCSVLKITMQKANTTVSKIQIVTDQYLNGDFTVNYNDGTPTLEYVNTGNVNNHTKITTLTFANNVSIDESHDFYIYLPANTYNYFQIKVYDASGNFFTNTSNRPLTFNRSVYNKLTIPASAINFYPGDLNGKFTVSSDGRKVSFSKGNLQKNGSIYQFANYQYNKQDGNYTYLFQWASNSTASTYNEPGNNTIVNGNGSTWRTLTGPEWDYLLRLRTGARWNLVKINNIKGVIIYPDNFVWPLEDNAAPTYQQHPSTDYGTKTFTLNEWQVLEDAGCVFLPATGHIQKNSSSVSTPTYGYYWSSTAVGTDFNTRDYAFIMYIQPTSLAFPGSNNATRQEKTSYSAVRLVKDVQ
jgi:hypothetical protein